MGDTYYRIELEHTQALLGNAGVFTSEIHPVGTYNHIRGVLSTDQSGSLVIKHASRNGSLIAVTTIAVTGGTPVKFDEICYGLYAQLIYTNGATPQTSFYLSINGDPFGT